MFVCIHGPSFLEYFNKRQNAPSPDYWAVYWEILLNLWIRSTAFLQGKQPNRCHSVYLIDGNCRRRPAILCDAIGNAFRFLQSTVVQDLKVESWNFNWEIVSNEFEFQVLHVWQSSVELDEITAVMNSSKSKVLAKMLRGKITIIDAVAMNMSDEDEEKLATSMLNIMR